MRQPARPEARAALRETIKLRVAIVAIVVILYLGPWRAPRTRRYDS